MRAFGFKAGIGSASRVLPANLGGYVVGVLVNDNTGSSRAPCLRSTAFMLAASRSTSTFPFFRSARVPSNPRGTAE